MQPGDFILTPSWTYHDHGNPGDTPVVWMDGLDIPIVNMFDSGFAEHHPDNMQPVARNEGDALTRYGSNLLPLEYTPAEKIVASLHVSVRRSRETLDALYRSGPLHPSHGIKMQFVNPATGGYPLPTIAAFLQFLPRDFHGTPYRSTDATVFYVIEGHGMSQVGDTSIAWQPHDIFVVPSWNPVAHATAGDAVLFSFSDRPVQKALGLWREEEMVRIDDSRSSIPLSVPARRRFPAGRIRHVS